jgi:hypothetical protein
MKNVEKNNKMIAEFMDWDCDNIGTMAPEVFRYKVYFEYNPKEFFTTTIYKYKDCLFHSSWDWLMPVVEKIEEEYLVDIFGKAISIYDEKKGEFIVDNPANYKLSKIENIYLGVVNFINNKNNGGN